MLRFFQFCLVGLVGFFVDFLFFFISSQVFNPYFSKVIGFLIAVQATFFLNSYLTFKGRSRSYLLYVLGQGKGFIVNFLSFYFILGVFSEFSYGLILSFAAASVIALVFNYVYANYLAFRER